jgi:hypothetical protein
MLVVAGLAALSGCVERRYTVRSDPPGALLIANDEEIGPTPASRSFVYYGDREFTLMLDGYQTQSFRQPIKAPWWDNYITEFFTENLVPYTFRDERDFTFKLTPIAPVPRDELIARGENLRQAAQADPPPRRKGILGFLGF